MKAQTLFRAQALQLVAIGLLTQGIASAAHAAIDPNAAKKQFADAQTLYSKRDSSSKLTELLELAAKSESSEDAEVKYGSLLLACKALYFKGLQSKGVEEKASAYSQGMAKCEAARSLQPNWADAYYHYAQNLAAWSQTQGIAALSQKKAELFAFLHSAIALKTKDGRPGESLDGQGPTRELAKMFLLLPEHSGGSQVRAVELLSQAQVKAPSFAENTALLAEALMDGGDAEKSRARQLLKELTGKGKGDFESSREPETMIQLAKAKSLLTEI